MRSLALKSSTENFASAMAQCGALSPDLIVAFGAPAHFNDPQWSAAIKGKPFIGCSTAGEISAGGVADNSISLVAMGFDNTGVRMAKSSIADAGSSRAAGENIAAQLNMPGLKSVFILSPGTGVNGSELVKGITSKLPDGVTLTGGLAGDGAAFKQTYTIYGDAISTDQVVAFGLYGNNIHVHCGSHGGWKPYGPARLVTRSENNILYEIDHKPALELYKHYLGDKAEQLPSSGLFYPFGILYGDDSRQVELIRTILDVDHKAQSLVLAGDMPQGAKVCLMHADTDSLVDGARRAADETFTGSHKGDSALLLVSCVGRKLIMGQDIDEEVDAIMERAGSNVAAAGFCSYGEIGPLAGGQSELHNETVTLTHISET